MQCVAYLAVLPLFAALAATALAQTPDLNRPEVQTLRMEFLKERGLIDTKRQMVLEAMLSKQLEGQRAQRQQAKIRGNTTRQADAAQAIAIFEKALADLEQKDRFDFPKNVRPALERMLDLSARTRDAEDETRATARKRLDGAYIDTFTALLEQQGVHGLDRQQVQALWLEALDRSAAAASAADAVPTETPVPANSPAADGSVPPIEDTVLQSRGAAANWVALARLEVTVQTLEIITLPLLDRSEPEVLTGTGLESGAPWRASLKPIRTFTRPTGALPAMRLRTIPGRLPVDVVEWPSPRNDWKIVVRVRPPSGGLSQHGGLLEIDGAALGTKP